MTTPSGHRVDTSHLVLHCIELQLRHTPSIEQFPQALTSAHSGQAVRQLSHADPLQTPHFPEHFLDTTHETQLASLFFLSPSVFLLLKSLAMVFLKTSSTVRAGTKKGLRLLACV